MENPKIICRLAGSNLKEGMGRQAARPGEASFLFMVRPRAAVACKSLLKRLQAPDSEAYALDIRALHPGFTVATSARPYVGPLTASIVMYNGGVYIIGGNSWYGLKFISQIAKESNWKYFRKLWAKSKVS